MKITNISKQIINKSFKKPVRTVKEVKDEVEAENLLGTLVLATAGVLGLSKLAENYETKRGKNKCIN